MPAALTQVSTSKQHTPPATYGRRSCPTACWFSPNACRTCARVSMGAWINSGSRDETAEENGISHFVEHMVFKGTTSRSAQHIAREVDTIGGNLDAFTGKETVCFNIKVLDENVDPALDVLADLVLHPKFSPADLAREQGVILEEIKMDEDNPDYLVHETFTQNFWKNHALGRPILGTAKTVSSFDQRGRLRPPRAAGLRRRTWCSRPPATWTTTTSWRRSSSKFGALAASSETPAARRRAAPVATPHITLKQEEVARAGADVPRRCRRRRSSDADRFAVYLLNSMLGGGMSSRLFQSIREDEGLAYSIYSEMSPFRDTGSLCVYAGMLARQDGEACCSLRFSELRRLKQETVTEAELKRAKDQMKTNIVLGLESSAAGCRTWRGSRCTSAGSSASTRSRSRSSA